MAFWAQMSRLGGLGVRGRSRSPRRPRAFRLRMFEQWMVLDGVVFREDRELTWAYFPTEQAAWDWFEELWEEGYVYELTMEELELLEFSYEVEPIF